jgi:hypothetical protein
MYASFCIVINMLLAKARFVARDVMAAAGNTDFETCRRREANGPVGWVV